MSPQAGTKKPPLTSSALRFVALSLDGSAGCVAVLRVFMGGTLIIGRDEDLCCRLVREHLLSLGRQVVYLPEGQLFPGLHFTWELRDGDSNGTLELAEQTVGFNQIDSVLARFSGIATPPEDFQTKDGQYLSSEWNALMRGYVQGLPCPVVNRLGPELWYRSSSQSARTQLLRPGPEVPAPPDNSFDVFRGCPSVI